MSTIVLDRERSLRFDYDALDRLSALPLARRGDRSPHQLWLAATGMDTRAMALLLWAGCRHDDADLTIDKAETYLKQALRMKKTTYMALINAVSEAMNESDAIGLTAKDDPAAGDTEGNDKTATGRSD